MPAPLKVRQVEACYQRTEVKNKAYTESRKSGRRIYFAMSGNYKGMVIAIVCIVIKVKELSLGS